MYYARAHNAQKTRAVLNSLISLSLGNSSAYPSDKELDEQLRSFLDTKTDALHDLAILDQEAAQTLAAHFSGYATVRRFYDTRDLHHRQSRSYGSVISKSARLTECGLMLVSLISSASVGIRGGLIDPEAESIVPTDNLIALFGELLPLFGSKPPSVSQKHY